MAWLEPAIFVVVFKASQSTYNKPVNSTVFTATFVLVLLKNPQLLQKPVFPLPSHTVKSTTHKNLSNSDIVSSQGLTPLVCRSKPVLRPRVTDWDGSRVPLKKNPAMLLQIYTHSPILPPKWSLAIYLEKGKYLEILSIFRYQIWPDTQKHSSSTWFSG